MQTPEPEGSGSTLLHPYPWGTDTATARGGEEAPGTRDTGGGKRDLASIDEPLGTGGQ